jgi:hypothetical protein
VRLSRHLAHVLFTSFSTSTNGATPVGVTSPTRWSGWLGEPGFFYDVIARRTATHRVCMDALMSRPKASAKWSRTLGVRTSTVAESPGAAASTTPPGWTFAAALQLSSLRESGLTENVIGASIATRHASALHGFFNECDWRCIRRVTSPARCSRAASRNRILYEIGEPANGCVTGAFDVFSTAHRARAADGGATEFDRVERILKVRAVRPNRRPRAHDAVRADLRTATTFPSSRRRRFEGRALLARH